jgi:hypothetical protein
MTSRQRGHLFLDALVATEIRTAHARQPSATCAASVNLRAYS